MAMTASRARPQGADTSSVYVYGVTWAEGAAVGRSAGIAGGRVASVEHGELAAIVSPGPAKPVRTKRRELMRHLEVVQDVFASATVLPLQFGSVFPSREVLVDELLEGRHDELVRLLQRFEGVGELRLRASYRQDEILAELVRSDTTIARLREQTRSRGRGVDALQLRLGEAVARALARRREQDARMIANALLPLALDAVVEDPRTEYELMRASYLVGRHSVAAFDARMDELAHDHEATIAFTYTGPLPPHTFVSLSPRGG